jgi:hypothetical protein
MKISHEEAERRLRDLASRFREVFTVRYTIEDKKKISEAVRKQFAKETSQDVNDLDSSVKRNDENQ